jgi:hypothetical protein
VTDRPPILVAHGARFVREALVTALREERPDDDIRAIALDELEDALLDRPSTVIAITSDAAGLVRTAARAWILLSECEVLAVVGDGNASRVLVRAGIADIATAVDELIRETTSPRSASTNAGNPTA